MPSLPQVAICMWMFATSTFSRMKLKYSDFLYPVCSLFASNSFSYEHKALLVCAVCSKLPHHHFIFCRILLLWRLIWKCLDHQKYLLYEFKKKGLNLFSAPYHRMWSYMYVPMVLYNWVVMTFTATFLCSNSFFWCSFLKAHKTENCASWQTSCDRYGHQRKK